MHRSLRLIDIVPSSVPVFVPATYAVTVAVNWEVLQQSRAWSESQIFVTHGDDFELWGEGLAASSGLAHFVKTDDEKPLLDEISRESAAGLIGDYLVADALSFYDVNKSGTSNDKLVARSPHTQLSMATTVHVGAHWWFTGFTGVSAAVPASKADTNEGKTESGGADFASHKKESSKEEKDKDKDMVWLDSFTVPIFPYKVGKVAATKTKGGGTRSLRDLGMDGGGIPSPADAPSPSGPELWAKAHQLPPGGPISRVVALVEADYNVPLAYVEFHRVPNAWEDSTRSGVFFRHWGTGGRSIPLTLPFITIVGIVGAVAACIGAYVLMNACCSRLKREGEGYSTIRNTPRSSGGGHEGGGGGDFHQQIMEQEKQRGATAASAESLFSLA